MPVDRRRPPAGSLRLPFAAVALLALALLGGAARAQSYRIDQGGTALGTFHVALTRSVAGVTSDSKLTLSGLAELSDRLVTDAKGFARSYRLTGTARGVQLTMNVDIGTAAASFQIDQGGKKQTLQVPLSGPVVVLDNNMLDGWQIVARQLDPSDPSPQRFDVLVPQSARTGSVSFEAQGRGPVEVTGHTVEAQRYDATLDVAGHKVGLKLWLDAKGEILAFAQPSASVRFELATAASQAAAAASASQAQAALAARLAKERRCLVEHDVTVRSTGQTLAGTLTVPTGSAARSARAPALLLIPGSGAVDRNGNAPPVLHNAMYQQLAYALACRGFAVLRIDKLGIGASSGDANAVTLQTYARNAADWVALLRSRPDIDPARVGLMGHSEGGLVALYAAVHSSISPAVVVLLESPGRPLGPLLIDQLARLSSLRGGSAEEVATVRRQAEQAVQAVRASHGTRLDLAGALASNPVAATFAHAAGLLRSEIDVDPAALAARVRVPVLVVQGGKDVQVPTRNGEALAAAAPKATYLFFPDLEHDLYGTAGKPIDAALPGPGTLLSGALLDALGTYLTGHLMAAAP